jgi:DNA-binding CsgD family transcriptional regulator
MQTVSIVDVFKGYCYERVQSRATDISPEDKAKLVEDLKSSPFRSVVQSWSVLDFYTYTHLYQEGYEKYLDWESGQITAEKILDIVHPEDKEAFTQLYYLVLEGLMNMPIPVKNIGHFCISYRVQTGNGNYVKVLETNSIIASDEEKNIPLICLSQMSIVDKIDRSDKVKYYFLIRDENGSVEIMSEYLKQFNQVVNIFSESEIKIIKLMRQGFTSQEIADQIFLSKHTIDKYRKNMLEKTGCANSAELLTHVEDIGIM